MPHVTVAGDTTGGGSGNPQAHVLAKYWQYTVPRWIEYTPDMKVIEWNGIAPAVLVPATEADFDRAVDPVFEYALQWGGAIRSQSRGKPFHT